jgi:O-antigen/teichoic acid export membrane protein
MNTVHRSLFFSAIQRYGNMLSFIIAAAVLSRLLTPKEFGIYALTNAAVSMTVAFYQEFGGANYLIQKHSLSERDIRTAFTFTLCLSALSAIALYGLRGMAADFFSEEGLKIGLAVAALNFIVTPFSMTIEALLRRDMLFGVLARCSVVGSFVTAVTSIALAALKYSFMAPIWGAVIGNVTVLTLLIVSRNDLRIFKPTF